MHFDGMGLTCQVQVRVVPGALLEIPRITVRAGPRTHAFGEKHDEKRVFTFCNTNLKL